MSYKDLDMLGIYPPLVHGSNITATEIDERNGCVPRKCKKKESDMIATANAATATITATTEIPGRREKDYLLSRLECINDDHVKTLRKKYHMDSHQPKTPNEMMKMLKDGHYELDTKMMERYSYGYDDPEDENIYWGNILGFLRFRNPKNKKDLEGYNKALGKLKEARQDAKDTIIVKSLDDGFLALSAFTNTEF